MFSRLYHRARLREAPTLIYHCILLLFALISLGLTACDEPAPTPTPKAKKPPMPGVTFIRGGVVIEDFKATLDTWVEGAPKPGPPQALGYDADGAIFIPVAWFPGQRFVVRVGEHGYGAAAPLRPWIYALLDRRVPVPEGLTLTPESPGVQVAISLGGDRVVISDFGGALELLPLPGGLPLAQRPGAGSPLDGLYFSRSGAEVITEKGMSLQAYSGAELSLLWSVTVPGSEILQVEPLGEPEGGVAVLVAEGAGARLIIIDGKGEVLHRLPRGGPLKGQGMLDVDAGGLRAMVGAGDQLLWGSLATGSMTLKALDEAIAGVAISPGGEGGIVALKGGETLSLDWTHGALTRTAGMALETPIIDMALTHRGLYSLGSGPEGGALMAFDLEGERRFRHKIGPGGGIWVSPEGRYLAIPILRGEGAPKGPGLSVYDRDIRVGGLSGPTLHERLQRVVVGEISASQDALFLGIRALPREPGDSLMLRVYR